MSPLAKVDPSFRLFYNVSTMPSGRQHGMYRHGHSLKGKVTKEYRAWCHMLRRCELPSVERYPRYGGRGIKVCKRWHNFSNFLNDMGNAPSPKHSLDRIDNDGNYEHKNCRWATNSEQILNSSKARFITFNNKTYNIGKWSKITGINRQTIQMRIDHYGWPIQKALGVRN